MTVSELSPRGAVRNNDVQPDSAGVRGDNHRARSSRPGGLRLAGALLAMVLASTGFVVVATGTPAAAATCAQYINPTSPQVQRPRAGEYFVWGKMTLSNTGFNTCKNLGIWWSVCLYEEVDPGRWVEPGLSCVRFERLSTNEGTYYGGRIFFRCASYGGEGNVRTRVKLTNGNSRLGPIVHVC